jgi:purine-binding chemotaxis protein CheW
MSEDRRSSLEHAPELRRAFDRSFAEPPAGEVAPAEGFLAVQVGGDAYALRLREVIGLFKDRRVIPLPSPLPGLLGIAGFRGSVVPVYDLRSLLGYRQAEESPRWLVLTSPSDLVGLGFDAFEGQLSARREDVAAASRGVARAYVSQAVRGSGLVRPIVDVASVVEAIRSRAREGPQRSADR